VDCIGDGVCGDDCTEGKEEHDEEEGDASILLSPGPFQGTAEIFNLCFLPLNLSVNVIGFFDRW
jgi:hypothetical protein